jgi:nucleotide sugar dehydrogenase
MLADLSGLVPGEDFYLVFSPERVLTGRVFADLRRYPKLLGGINDASEERGVAFYEAVLDFDNRDDLQRPNGVWRMGTCEAAEMAKLAETTYRDVNIGLANQFAKFADRAGIDVYKVIEACNSQPYSHILQPGIAVGGHCIPVYPRLYLHIDPDATIVRAAREANESMPEYAVQLLEDRFGGLEGARVAVLGAAYRGGVKETAFSGVFRLTESLARRGADVRVHDYFYSDSELRDLGLTPYHFGEDVDFAIVQADHADYAMLTEQDLPAVRVVLNGRAGLRMDLRGVAIGRTGPSKGQDSIA